MPLQQAHGTRSTGAIPKLGKKRRISGQHSEIKCHMQIRTPFPGARGHDAEHAAARGAGPRQPGQHGRDASCAESGPTRRLL